MQPLVNFYDGEPWFDNPLLTVANPKRRKKTMRRRRRSRRGRKNAPRRMRRNFYSAGALANRPRRRRRSHRRRRSFRHNAYFPMNRRKRRSHRRSFRRNPSFLGFSLPPMADVLYTAAGFIGPNVVSNQILTYLPASVKTNADGTPNQLTIWATKIASVFIPAYLIRRFVNPRAGLLFLVGGAAGLAIDALKTFAPSVAQTLHLGSQPLLGSYFTRPQGQIANFPRQARVPAMIADAPARLDPSHRF